MNLLGKFLGLNQSISLAEAIVDNKVVGTSLTLLQLAELLSQYHFWNMRLYTKNTPDTNWPVVEIFKDMLECPEASEVYKGLSTLTNTGETSNYYIGICSPGHDQDQDNWFVLEFTKCDELVTLLDLH